MNIVARNAIAVNDKAGDFWNRDAKKTVGEALQQLQYLKQDLESYVGATPELSKKMSAVISAQDKVLKMI